jgi:hypothetical protein
VTSPARKNRGSAITACGDSGELVAPGFGTLCRGRVNHGPFGIGDGGKMGGGKMGGGKMGAGAGREGYSGPA